MRCSISGISHEIEDESIVDFLGRVLGHVIGDVLFSRDVYQVELVLAYAVPDPVESHVDRLAAFYFDVVVRQSNGGGVVTQDGCERLQISQVGENSTKAGGVLAAGKECSVLGFACGCYDARDNCRDSGYGAVDARRLVFVAQKKDTADN